MSLLRTFYSLYDSISRGVVPNSSIFLLEGHADDITTTPKTIWNGTGIYSFVTAAETLDIVSSSAADTFLTGAGAWVVTLLGLDASGNIQQKNYNLNGLTTVTTTGDNWYRLWWAFVVAANSAGAGNVGTITISGTTSATVFGIMDPQKP